MLYGFTPLPHSLRVLVEPSLDLIENIFVLSKEGPATMAGGGYESDMAGYKDILSDDEIIAVLSYIKSKWPAEIRQSHDRMNARRQ